MQSSFDSWQPVFNGETSVQQLMLHDKGTLPVFSYKTAHRAVQRRE